MTMKVSIVVSNYLQEVGIMNSHIDERIANEEFMDIMRSIEFFVVIVVVVSVAGLVCIAVV